MPDLAGRKYEGSERRNFCEHCNFGPRGTLGASRAATGLLPELCSTQAREIVHRNALAFQTPIRAFSGLSLDWLCEYLGVQRSKVTAHLYLHQGRSETQAKRYWARILQISEQQFRKSYRPVPRPSHKGNVHKYGVCAVRLHSKMTHRMITSWIGAILNHSNQFSRVAQLAEHLAVNRS